MVAFFVDLKAAFNTVNRSILGESMRGRGLNKGLIEKVMEMLREMTSKVTIGGESEESLWTARIVRQMCPLNPLLYSIYR